MHTRDRMLFGPLAAALFGVGIVGLALMVPGYSQIHQTVSEIGEVGSPARVPFSILLVAIAACIAVFASSIRDASIAAARSPFVAYVTGFMALSTAGVGVFAYPHPLHNVFGLSELIGYQAPWVLALTWRSVPRVRPVVAFSWIMTALVWAAFVVNLLALDRAGAVWTHVQPFYGLVQRCLFAFWFAWCAGVGVLLLRRA
jgi:hypothetical protein